MEKGRLQQALRSAWLAAVIIFCGADALAVVSCKDAQGRPLYTDDARKCVGSAAAPVQLQHSADTRVNYRYPERHYEAVQGRWPILIERPENEADRPAYAKGVERLQRVLTKVFAAFPEQAHAQLRPVTFYLMRGPKSSLGGEDRILRYMPTAVGNYYSLNDKRWSNAVVIYSLDNFMGLTDVWAAKVIAHELAHAWHFLRWGFEYQPIKDAWLNSRTASLFLAVRDNRQRLLTPAYASTNPREYFADLSAMYFVGGDYYPFDKKGLQSYDPVGYAMIETHWLQRAPPTF